MITAIINSKLPTLDFSRLSAAELASLGDAIRDIERAALPLTTDQAQELSAFGRVLMGPARAA